ncbi:hypothetical protein GGF37_001679 [Kickxella alabastrina]|nr:hypothetical protein GGF37_001679 [Kickxella alabastrina]
MEKQQQLEKCAQLLSKRSTDDEKLAGLLLVPRIVDVQDSESLGYIFEAMDIKFLERLLRTGMKRLVKKSSDLDTDTSGESPMLGIAVAVIAVFASHSAIAQQAKMVDRIPTLYKVAVLGVANVSAEATQALCKILALDAGIRRILEQPESFVEAIAAVNTGIENIGALEVVDFALNRSSTFIHAQDNVARFASGWNHLVAHIASAFGTMQGALKFELMGVLASSLEPIDSEDATAIDNTVSCSLIIANISSGCIWVLRQKSETSKYADQALVLYSHLVRLWPNHTFLSKADVTLVGPDSEPTRQKDAELVLRLACIEGQASIDTMMISRPVSMNQRDSVQRSERARTRLGWKFPTCAEIAAGWLEWIGQWLDAQSESADVDEDAIYELMSEVQKLSQAAIGFLVDFRERMGDEKEMMDISPELVLSSIRLLGQWLATDPKLHKSALPVLAMSTNWILQGGEYSKAINDYMRPCVSFALDTCDISEAQYIDDLTTRQSHLDRKTTQSMASPWFGTIEFDDLARAVYNIPSDEDILRARREA